MIISVVNLYCEKFRHLLVKISESKSLVPFILIMITGVGSALRIYHLGSKPLWYDEAVTFWIAQGNLKNILSQNSMLNSAPPLFVILTSLISRLGEAEWILRVIPWLAGSLTIPAMYFFAKQHLSKPGALIAALIIAIAPIQISYSQELREYSLSVLLSILMVSAFGWYIRDTNRRSTGILMIVIVLGLFTQYGLALINLALNGFFFIHLLQNWSNRKKLLPPWITIQFVALIAVFMVYQLSLKGQFQPGGFAAEVTSLEDIGRVDHFPRCSPFYSPPQKRLWTLRFLAICLRYSYILELQS